MCGTSSSAAIISSTAPASASAAASESASEARGEHLLKEIPHLLWLWHVVSVVVCVLCLSVVGGVPVCRPVGICLVGVFIVALHSVSVICADLLLVL